MLRPEFQGRKHGAMHFGKMLMRESLFAHPRGILFNMNLMNPTLFFANPASIVLPCCPSRPREFAD
jgi:hypothetical protein